MNGDDYDNRRKVKRISVEIADSKETVLVALASGEGGTSVYVDGRLERTDRSLRLTWPDGSGGTRLVVGNSVSGRHPWRGELFGLGVIGSPLDEDDVADLVGQWQDRGEFTFYRNEGFQMLFPFTEGSGEIAYARSGNGIHLQLLARMQILKKEMLVPPWRNWSRQSGLGLDVALNFFGFWPLGFFLCALVAGTRRFGRHPLPVTVLFCFAFSLFLETVQVWVPSRSSDMLDLIMNTLGGGAGAMIYAVMGSRF